VSFGKVAVLEEHSRTLTIHNPTPIEADFKLFIEGRDSSFSVEPRELRLGPGDSSDVSVRALFDETQPFKDELHVLIAEGADMPVPLDATGKEPEYAVVLWVQLADMSSPRAKPNVQSPMSVGSVLVSLALSASPLLQLVNLPFTSQALGTRWFPRSYLVMFWTLPTNSWAGPSPRRSQSTTWEGRPSL
jgi:hypothetical protein